MTTPGNSILPAGVTKVIGSPLSGVGKEADRQFTLADVDPIGRSEVMIYGPVKAGKTVLAATFPPPFRWLAADGQTSLKSLRWAVKEGKSSITDPATQLVGYVPFEEMNGSYPKGDPMAFNRAIEMIGHWFSPGEVEKWEGGTLVLDGATEMSEWAMYQGLSLNVKLPDTKKPLSTSDKINRQAKARILTGQQDYKSAMALFEGMIQDVRSDCAKFNRNLVLICHEWTDTDDEGNVLRYQPLLIGQLRERLGKAFDDIWYIQTFAGVKGPEPKLLMQGDARHVGGTRWGSIMAATEDPDYRLMIAKVKKYHGL